MRGEGEGRGGVAPALSPADRARMDDSRAARSAREAGSGAHAPAAPLRRQGGGEEGSSRSLRLNKDWSA